MCYLNCTECHGNNHMNLSVFIPNHRPLKNPGAWGGGHFQKFFEVTGTNDTGGGSFVVNGWKLLIASLICTCEFSALFWSLQKEWKFSGSLLNHLKAVLSRKKLESRINLLFIKTVSFVKVGVLEYVIRDVMKLNCPACYFTNDMKEPDIFVHNKNRMVSQSLYHS